MKVLTLIFACASLASAATDLGVLTRFAKVQETCPDFPKLVQRALTESQASIPQCIKDISRVHGLSLVLNSGDNAWNWSNFLQFFINVQDEMEKASNDNKNVIATCMPQVYPFFMRLVQGLKPGLTRPCREDLNPFLEDITELAKSIIVYGQTERPATVTVTQFIDINPLERDCPKTAAKLSRALYAKPMPKCAQDIVNNNNQYPSSGFLDWNVWTNWIPYLNLLEPFALEWRVADAGGKQRVVECINQSFPRIFDTMESVKHGENDVCYLAVNVAKDRMFRFGEAMGASFPGY